MRINPVRLTAAIVAALMLSAAPRGIAATTQDPPAAAGSASDELRTQADRLRADGYVVLAGDTVSATVLAEFYDSRVFRLAWRNAGRVDALIRAVRSMQEEGLEPAHYHLGPLEKLVSARTPSAADSATLDMLSTSALHRVAEDLRRGRVDRAAADASWAAVEAPQKPLGADGLGRLVESADITAAIDELRPAHPIYTGMREALARYRAIRDDGGWPTLPERAWMRRDSASGPIDLLRRRLAIEGYLEDSSGGAPAFDETLEAAVRRFQHTHGLNDDGVVGPATLAALNVPVEQRIDAIRVNMERARWVLPGLADRFVSANIAGQKVYYFQDGEVVFETRAIVGTEGARSPVFADTMTYIVLNPDWTVPRSINREILDGIRSDPSYLSRLNFVVIDSSANRVDTDGIDFGRYTGATFPWTFRQLPGPLNPLGRIKFMFPNRYNVYLHDTPARSAFEREQRTFSHGCIRVEDPFRLAELVLAGQHGGDRASLMDIVESGEMQTIELERPVPVLLLYWTAAADLHGELHFYRDIYDRDETVLNALDAPARR